MKILALQRVQVRCVSARLVVHVQHRWRAAWRSRTSRSGFSGRVAYGEAESGSVLDVDATRMGRERPDVDAQLGGELGEEVEFDHLKGVLAVDRKVLVDIFLLSPGYRNSCENLAYVWP